MRRDILTNTNRISFGHYVSLIALLLMIVAAYSNAMTGAFLFDDFGAISENKSIQAIWPLSQSLWAPKDAPTAGRPVVNFSFALNYAAGGLNVFGYHLVNLFIHCLNTGLLLSLCYRSLMNLGWNRNQPKFAWGGAASIAALWALHPIQTESVTYVTQRTELMMAFFLLLTLYAALQAWEATARMESMVWQSIAIVSCGLGMASKEVMVVAPVLVVLYDLTIYPYRGLAFLIKRRWGLYIGLMATWLILATLMSTNPRGQSVGFGHEMKSLDYLTTQFWGITHYLWLVLWPAKLCGDYGVFVVTDIGTWLPRLSVLIAIAVATLYAWFRHPGLAFLGGCFFLVLAPTSSFVPIVSEPIAERRMYLPLAAVVAVLVIGAVTCLQRLPFLNAALNSNSTRSRALLAVPAIFLSAVYAYCTFARNAIYQSELTFWTDVVEKRPDNSRGVANLGLIFAKEKKLDLARSSFERAIELAPSNADAHFNMGVWYSDQGLASEAIPYYEQALELRPGMSYARCNLGKCYIDQGRFDEAMEQFNQALVSSPSMANALYSRGLLYSIQRRYEEATRDLIAAIDADPNVSIQHFQLGNVYLAQKRYSHAAERYRAAIRLDPKLAGAYLNLGAALARSNQFDEAVQAIEKAIELEPKNIDAFHNLGHCNVSLGRTDKAIEAYQQCIAIQPQDAHAWYRLGKVYMSTKNESDARNCFKRVLELDANSTEARTMLNQLGVE
jgi:tetratricopeptide (TPR) repeat protein